MAADNCLVNCYSQFGCGPILKPIDGNNIGPFAKLRIKNSKKQFTVANRSTEFVQTATIKSMEHGWSDGEGVIVEIHDERGGSFANFIDSISKNINKADQDYKMEIQYGWVIKGCGSSADTLLSKSPVFTFLPNNCETNYSQGKFKFRITGQDLLQQVFEARADKPYGSERAKITLKQALTKLFNDTSYPPVINNLKFLRKEGNSTTTYKFLPTNDEEGPLGVWTPNQRTKLLVAYEWLKTVRTDRDKGITINWDATQSQPTLVFWEDGHPKCNESQPPNCLGTYIVNGGSCSPVIEFNPSIKWNYAAVTGPGGGLGPGNAKPIKQERRPGCEETQDGNKAVGTQTNTQTTGKAILVHGPENAVKEEMKADAAHQAANAHLGASGYSPITADLRVIGDPEFPPHPSVMFSTVALIVINPFHLGFGSADDGCETWLARPSCNEILSNKNWWIESVVHRIEEGSYTTTLSLRLLVPGIDFAANAPLGGPGGGGQVLKGT